MMKTTFKIALSIAFLSLSCNSYSAAYDTDPQAQYPKDQTQDTFQFASMVACIIKAFAPEQNVGVGQYLAYVDENKCNDSGASASSTSASGGSTQVPPKYSKGLVTVTQGSAGELKVDTLFKVVDEENGAQVPKDIQVRATIYSGANVAPPYGRWDMDFCSSKAGTAGSCNDGNGYVRVSSDGLVVFNKNDSGYRAGKSIYSNAGGSSGYGAVYAKDTRWLDQNANSLFAFAPGKYSLQDRQASKDYCYNPSVSARGVLFSVWENYLYSQSTRARIAYENPGFYLKSNFSDNTVGDVTYWGVNFWNEADASDQLAGATLRNASNVSETYTLRKAPGRLQKVSTTITAGLGGIDGIPLNLGIWGYNYTTNTGVTTQDLLGNLLGRSVTANSASLIGSWSAANQRFEFTGYQTCNNSGCSNTAFGSTGTRTLAQLVAFGVSDVNAWVNGVNVSYNFRVSNWVSPSVVAVTEPNIQVIKQSSVVLNPTDSTIPANLVCVGTCPAVSSGNLVDVNSTEWPPRTSTTLTWSTSLGAPTVTGGGVTKAVDWGTAGNNHWYQFYNQSDLATMRCDAWNRTTNSTDVNGGFCTDKVNRQANSTYYTWQSGNRWDAYNYLVYKNGPKVGTTVSPNPPLNLSLTVSNTQGNLPGYIGKTITVQSPQPGNIWLPGHCVNAAREEVPCSSSSGWVNEVSIPTVANDTGSVTLLNASGTATSTKYFAKWLKRGVYYEPIAAAQCSSLSADLTKAQSVELPGISGWDTTITTMGVPWPTAPFNGSPRVIDGVLQ